MALHLAVNFPAPIPVGHRVEITRFADPRPENKRHKDARFEPFTYPALLDLDTGIRYLNHAHVSRGGNGGLPFFANPYPFEPLPDLTVDSVTRGRVTACTLVMVEGLNGQHTMLAIAPELG